jgi:predicted GNAT family N-acyltransferase
MTSSLGFSRVLTDYIFKALIFDVIVSEDKRGQGLGHQLLSLIKNHGQLKSVKHFELYCVPEMFAFYEKHGFTTNIGEIKLMRLVNA